ncbi:metallo-beta-lactamase superfamily protein [Aphelenchoides avenae]|nr:metallo-beta-lactamase superfamily protein [Aphelenchus avenae]
MQSGQDFRRPNKIVRFKPVDPQAAPVSAEDSLPEYMNVLGMIFSMAGLMMRLKWCAWVALLCSCVSFANTRASDDAKQIVSSFMLSISAVVMSYLQNPTPIVPPWAMVL